MKLVEEIGFSYIQDLYKEYRPVIFTFWHNRTFYLTYYHKIRTKSKGFPIAILISDSKDGEIIARIAYLWGGIPVRGSTTRGGRKGLKGLLRVIEKEKSCVITTPDGPLGPKYHFKEGTILLAQLSGAPILPMSYAVSSCWRLSSWDRFIIPKPFSKVVTAVGEPYFIPRKLSEEEREFHRQELEKRMKELDKKAKEALKKYTSS